MRPSFLFGATVLNTLVAATLGTAVSAQSLADVAAAEAKRRSGVAKPTKTISNEDLAPVPAASAPPPTAAADAADESSSAEDYWREKSRPIREKYAADQIAERAAWTLVKSMQDTGVNRTSPAEWLKALAEHQRLSDVVREDIRAFIDIAEQAARAGVKLDPYDGPVRPSAPSAEDARAKRQERDAKLRQMRQTLTDAESAQRDAQHQANVCSGSQGFSAMTIPCSRLSSRLAEMSASINRLRDEIATLEREQR
ncbi:MAG: hypothetical protein AB7H93_12185 [Vicinamibacterales bacterium]